MIRLILDTNVLASALVLGQLPLIERSKDPADNFLLAMAQAGKADYLVTGDKSDLLALKRHESTHIVTARRMATIMRLPLSGS
jgi:predicted nucleic acid-binding protein